MDVEAREVLYETRLHACIPFDCDFSVKQVKDNVVGGLFSWISLPGLRKITEKWDRYNQPHTIKKWAHLFISPGGQYVAVSVGNQLTIFQKDDNYDKACGNFINHDKISTFPHGAWSSCSSVLGIMDNQHVLYFIRSNGDEISRTSKELTLSGSVVGLIFQDEPRLNNEHLFSFMITTSNALFYQVRVRNEQSTSSVSLSSLAYTNKQFHGNVSCVDFHHELSLLVIVGGLVFNSNSFRTSAGKFCIYVCRMSRNMELKILLWNDLLEGLFSIPKRSESFTNPKVLISPQGKYVCTLDVTGSIDIFILDDHNISSCADGNACDIAKLHRANTPLARRKFTDPIVDFTWWSDHILIVAKESGSVAMFDILSGSALLENEPKYSLPVLERVRTDNGFVFLLVRIAPGENFLMSLGDGDKNMMESSHAIHKYSQVSICQRSWGLISFTEKSVSEMYRILINSRQYPAALDFANRHELDRDEVYKSQLHSNQNNEDIKAILSNIKDHTFVLSECLAKVGPTEDSAKMILSHGLNITNQYGLSDYEEGYNEQLWNFWKIRLQLLQCKDRLDTFVGINMGRFNAEEYQKFRMLPLNEVAIALAESGKIGALNLLFKRHPYTLSPFILEILSSIPETIPVQTYMQLLPGKSPPSTITLRDHDWVECEKVVSIIIGINNNNNNGISLMTEHVLRQSVGIIWPSEAELCLWYMNRARDIDKLSGQLENCLSLVECACQKGILELEPFFEDISYLCYLTYSDQSDEETVAAMNLIMWEKLSDYEKFKMLLKGVTEDNVLQRLREKAIPFMMKHSSDDQKEEESDLCVSFLVKWLKEIARENRLDICLIVIDEGFKESYNNKMFRDQLEAAELALECIYLCTLTDQWNVMSSILSKIPQIPGTTEAQTTPNLDAEIAVNIEKRIKVAEGHVESGRLLAYYQLPKSLSFFLGAESDEKDVKQLLRLIMSKFARRQPSKSDNEWATMWHDMQFLQEKAFPFLNIDFMLIEFCRGLLKSGKFSLARNYLKGTASVSLASEKAESLVIQTAREYFFSASSIACTEIWKAKECLNIFPNSRLVCEEIDMIEALTVKLPSLGVTLLPVQFKQIRNPMEIIHMVITNQTGAYINVDELIEIAKLLGLRSQDDLASIYESVAREAAMNGDLQLAFDLCISLVKKGHGSIWDLCAAIARGPSLDNMDADSRKILLGFALSHCDEESIGELLNAWKDLDLQIQCEKLMELTGTYFETNIDDQAKYEHLKEALAIVSREFPTTYNLSSNMIQRESEKFVSFASVKLPWLLELSRMGCGVKICKSLDGNNYINVRMHAVLIIISWLCKNDISPSDDMIGSLAKSVMDMPASEEENVLGFSFLLNLVDAFKGVEIIEEQLRTRKEYTQISSIMNMGMLYSALHNSGNECESPNDRKDLLLRKFHEKHAIASSVGFDQDEKAHSTFWREWKSKLEEKKRLADQTSALEKILPGVETKRFLSGDFIYIQSVIFCFIDSLKLEKKFVLKELLDLADIYGLNRKEILKHYLGSTLVSDLWDNDSILAEISQYTDEILENSTMVIELISSGIYPSIDGCDKHRLSLMYSMLSDCYLHLNKSKDATFLVHHDQEHVHSMELWRFYKVMEQECNKISFIKNFNFKNIAKIKDLNFDFFNDEVRKHIHESSIEALSKMVHTLTGIYKDTEIEGLMSWKDVYKYYVVGSLLKLETAKETKLHPTANDFRQHLSKIEINYNYIQIYIRELSDKDILELIWKYFMLSLDFYYSDKTNVGPLWMDCLKLLLSFWIRLADDFKEITCAYKEKDVPLVLCPQSLLKCLKIFADILMEDKITESQGWGTIFSYAKLGYRVVFSLDISSFCRAMIFSCCGFRTVSEMFLVASNCNEIKDTHKNLSQIYLDIANSIVFDSTCDPLGRQNLNCLLTSLSRLEGNLDDLREIRSKIWERLTAISDNMELENYVRVYALEILQSIAGNNLNNFSNVQPQILSWEGWDASLYTTTGMINTGGMIQTNVSNRFTNSLVALKSTQLASTILPDVEITAVDLTTPESALTHFSHLCQFATTEDDCKTLLAILEAWEGLFCTKKEDEEFHEIPNVENEWNNNEWDEGWEDFPEETIEEKKDVSISIHPLHACWLEIFKKLIKLSRFEDLMKLLDQSSSKAKGVLLQEEESLNLVHIVEEVNCVMGLKVAFLLPYERIWFHCLAMAESKLKQEGISEVMSKDYELLLLVLSSEILPTVIKDFSYNSFFSYLCYTMGHLGRVSQEQQLTILRCKDNQISRTNDLNILVFIEVLFPCFVAELVMGRQYLLACAIVSKIIHTHPSLSIINIAEATLRKYLERKIHKRECTSNEHGDDHIPKHLEKTVLRLKIKMKSLMESALCVLSTDFR